MKMAAYNLEGLICTVLIYSAILLIGILAAWKSNMYMSKTNSSVADEFLLAGRKIALSVGAFTLTATWVGGVLVNGTSEAVYKYGLVWTLAPVGYALSLIIGGTFFATKMREREYVTMLDPLQEQYGNLMGAVLYIPAFLGETFWTASILSALGSSISMILNVDVKITLIVLMTVVVFYTALGGLFSVICTNSVHLFLIAIGLYLTIPYALSHENVRSIVRAETLLMGELKENEIGQWIDYAMLLMFGGIPWQVYFQRVLSCRSPKDARLMSYAAALGCLVLATPAAFLGAAARSTDWRKIANVTTFIDNNGTITDARLTLPLVFQYLTPPWVSVIGLIAISSSIMSSVDSSILSASSMFGYNIYKIIIKPTASNKEVVWITRVCILFIGALAVSICLIVPSINIITYLCADLIYVLLVPQLFSALYIPSANSYGSIFAFIIGIFFRVTGGERSIGLPILIKYPMYRNNEQFFPFRTLAMLMSFLTLIVISYVTNTLFACGLVSRRYDVLEVIKRREQRYELNSRAATMMTELNFRLSLREARTELRRTNSVF